ncbi:MAG: hypothetical protein IRZ00_16230 [Gemmatimonadetes bacterium]|nr:hypothetical protein [Gemmatimonadota bacterium]
MDDRTRRELRLLKAYAVIVTLVLGTLSLAAFQRSGQRQKFGEIDVERINVVEPDGSYRLVISNKARSIGPIYKGKPFGYPGGTRPGLIFFNDEGTENGGLTFSGHRNPDGTYEAHTGMSFDQFDQDQIVVLSYDDRNGRRRAGLTIGDRASIPINEMVAERDSIMKLPEAERAAALERWRQPRNGVPLYAPRVYVGRDADRAAVVNLADPDGRPRIRLRVDSLGTPSIEFLDAAGKVTSRIPTAGG